MMTTVSIQIDDEDQVRCEHRIRPGDPAGEPILIIEVDKYREQGLDLFLSRGCLRRIRTLINAYFAAHPEPAEQPESLLCRSLMARPPVAEAATDVPCKSPRCSLRVDADELFASAVANFEPMRGSWGRDDDEEVRELVRRDVP